MPSKAASAYPGYGRQKSDDAVEAMNAQYSSDEEIPIVMATASFDQVQPDNEGTAMFASAIVETEATPTTLDVRIPTNTQVVTIDDPDDTEMETDAPLSSENTPLLEGLATSTAGSSVALTAAAARTMGRNGDGDADRNGDPDEAESSSSSSFRDGWFGVLWILHFAIIVYAYVSIAPKGFAYPNSLDGKDIHDVVDDSDDMTPEQAEQLEEFVHFALDYVQIYPHRILWYIMVPSAEIAVVLTLLYTYYVLRPYTKAHVQSTLIVLMAIAAVVVIHVMATTESLAWSILISMLILGSTAYFVNSVRPMIPFAAINLKVALAGISANSGIYLVALSFAEIIFIWCIFSVYTMVGTLRYLDNECHDSSNMTSAQNMATEALSWNNSVNGDASGQHFQMYLSTSAQDTDMGADTATSTDASDESSCANNQGWVFFAFLFSIYWTCNIIMNLLQVTIAGVMATWCFDKESAQWCCSPAVWSSMFRACTSSFGSVALGSFLQAFIAVLRVIVRQNRRFQRQTDELGGDTQMPVCGSMLGCGLECIAGGIQKILDYFNHWAYVYVGIHGYTYAESGKRVFQLFQAKGWTTIVTDQLVTFVLRFTSLFVAVFTGVLAILLDRCVTLAKRDEVDTDTPAFGIDDSVGDDRLSQRSYIFGPIPEWPFFAFVIGLLVGKLVATIMLQVIKGAVNTLLVCWADYPERMVELHPELTEELATTWSLIFPDQCAPSELPLNSHSERR